MTISKKDDIKLKLGNFCLAAILSIVPTAMTMGFLGVHGIIVCRSLEERIVKVKVLDSCEQANFDVMQKYIIWIWLFITIPTWRWFYIGHYRRLQNKKITN